MSSFSSEGDGGRNWIRTSEGVSQQIYSLPPLATWVSYPKTEVALYQALSNSCEELAWLECRKSAIF